MRIDRLLVKPVPVAVKMMPDAEMEPPYDGAKKMILVDDVLNLKLLTALVSFYCDICKGCNHKKSA